MTTSHDHITWSMTTLPPVAHLCKCTVHCLRYNQSIPWLECFWGCMNIQHSFECRDKDTPSFPKHSQMCSCSDTVFCTGCSHTENRHACLVLPGLTARPSGSQRPYNTNLLSLPLCEVREDGKVYWARAVPYCKFDGNHKITFLSRSVIPYRKNMYPNTTPPANTHNSR